MSWSDWPFILAGIGALGFLIVVHEAGHYVVARWCGMRVERFSVGFGPGILKHRAKSGTVFQLAPIPFGGFVEIRGMNIAEEVDPDDHHAYPNRPAWQRFVTIFAGPATNYLSAIVIAFALFTCRGIDSEVGYIGVDEVLPNYDAAGKLEAGDRILRVDGVEIFANDSLTKRITDKGGAPVELTVRRDGVERTVTITPRSELRGDTARERLADHVQALNRLAKERRGQASDYLRGTYRAYLLGIQLTVQIDPVSVGVVESAKRAVMYPIEKTVQISVGLYKIITREEKADPGGPVRIAEEFTKAFRYSWSKGIELLMLLSVYLGLFNLFPLPALDGGRLVFLGYELVTRRRANPKIESMVHMVGIMILFVVMILVTLKDCRVI